MGDISPETIIAIAAIVIGFGLLTLWQLRNRNGNGN